MSAILAALVLVIVAIVLWGVGAAVLRLTGSQSGPWPVSIAVGLSATIAAGGLLNLAHIAYRPTLWILAGLELAISLFELRRIRFRLDYDLRDCVEIGSAAIVIGLATLFAISTQLPPKVFNSHDDFENYLVYPVRMLATGTLSGSSLSGLGSVSFGGEAFLHGFVVSVSPIAYVNGVDAVFSFAVLMLVMASAGWKRYAWFPGALIGPLLVATINPQYVNVSPLYSGALLMATAVILIADDKSCVVAPAVTGLVYAATVALKPSFAIFVACYFPFALWAVRSGCRTWAPALNWAWKTVLWSSAFLAPWLLLHTPNYVASRSLPDAPVPAGSDGELNLLSTKTLFWGESFLHYSAIVIVAGAIVVLGLIAWRYEKELKKRQILLGIVGSAASGVLSYLITVVVLAKSTYGYGPNLRYTIPFILGTCVTSLVMSPQLSQKPKQHFLYFSLLASLAVCAAFVPSAIRRYRQAERFGSILAFSDLATSTAYANYNRFWLSDAGRQYIVQWQEKVPKGEPLLTWINPSFLLDYRRNVIVDADIAGLASPWARVPDNVRYVLWQYQGPEVRTDGDYIRTMHGPGHQERMIAARSYAFANRLSQVAQNSDVIASDGAFVLFKLRQQL